MISEAQKQSIKRYSQTPRGRQKRKEAFQRYRLKLKVAVLTHYGNGKLACVKCGEENIACLTIDHIENGGTTHRKQVGGPMGFYPWLKKQDYPKGYQTLCMNCQWKKKGSPSLRIKY